MRIVPQQDYDLPPSPLRPTAPSIAWSGEPVTTAACVLVIDSDAEAGESTLRLLCTHGLQGEVAADAGAADRRLANGDVDLIVLELALDGEDGLSLCHRLSLRGAPPILVLSDRAELMDRVLALELGADDHLAKSAHPLELIARVRALLRRQGRAAPVDPLRPSATQDADAPVDGWALVEGRRALKAPDGRAIRFTETEFRFVAAGFRRPGQTLPREQIERLVYGERPRSPRALNTLVSRVRRRVFQKLGQELVTTIYGVGYVFDFDKG